MPETESAVVLAYEVVKYGSKERLVEVARKCDAVGVDVATRLPKLLMDASILVPSPEKVIVEEVAVMSPPIKVLPLK